MQHGNLFIVALSLMAGITARAESLYLHIWESDGNWTVLDLGQVDKLTFRENGMQVLDAGDNLVKSFSSAGLASMEVSEQKVSGIIGIGSETDKSPIKLEGKILTIKEDGALAIHDAGGRLCVEILSVSAGQTVDLSAIVNGVYVVTLNGSTVKIRI